MTTLLEITQDVLTSIRGDQVDSISDTLEADSVVSVIKACFEEILLTKQFRETEAPFTLTGSGALKPTLMEIPDGVSNIHWVKYNTKETADPYPVWRTVQYMGIQDFLEYTLQLPSQTDTTIGSFVQNIQGRNITFYHRKDKAPEYYTTIDDNYLLFDSFDNAEESSLQESKTLCFGKINLEFNKTDGFVIPFDRVTTLQLIESAKSRASIEIRQNENPAADKLSRRLHIRSQVDSLNAAPMGGYEEIKGYGR